MFLASGKPLDTNFIKIGSFEFKWYAVLIFIGAFLAYKLSQYFGKKRGIKPEIYNDLFLICFPMGLVGARIWYVLSNASTMWSGHSFLYNYFDSVFAPLNFLANAIAVWEGGLAVQGGVVLGVITGIIYYRKNKFKFSLFDLFDTVIPNILIAQVLGRWGNFVNGEVFGACVEPEKLNWLPQFILNQQIYATDIYYECGGLAAQPLFLYEGILNLLGFILITFILRKYWTKRRYYGDLSALYFVWYGIVRILLEGFRNEIFIMKIFGIPTSIVTSALFIIGGIVWLFLTRYFAIKKGHTGLVYVHNVPEYVNEKKEEKKDEK